MKKSVVSLAASLATIGAVTAVLTPGGAFAQSGVSIYGVMSAVVRHTNNEIGQDANGNPTHGSLTKLEPGVFQGSRFGFKGVEEMGGNTSAVFQLEMGFNSANGESDQQGQIFGRQAFVGLKNKEWGEIDLGRQYGVAFDVLGNFDPLGMGNLTENAWQLYIIGVRFDNSLKYSNSWGPVKAEVQYSFGEQAGSMSIGSTTGFGLTYDNGVFSVGAFDQLSKDANSNKINVAGIGARLNMDPATFFLNYVNARRDAGFKIADSNSDGPLANTTLALNNANNTLRRTDNILTAGVLYQATPVMNYTLGYMTDFVRNESSAGNSGKLSTLYAVANYNLSKRTDVYLNLDYTRVDGGEIDHGDLTNTVLQSVGAGLGGAKNRTGVAIGLRTKF